MAHHHQNHGHHHSAPDNLRLAFFLNLGFTVLEFIGGLYVNSVAIISDALHDLGDSLSLGVSWFLHHKSRQQANASFTFGYSRFSLLGALINSLVLIAGSVFVVNEAVGRLLQPETPDAAGMLVFALIGVAVNGYAAWKVGHGSSINERVISWHLLEDVLGWVAVLVVSVVLLFREVPFLDPALSLLITVYILWNVLKRLKETLYVFLQGSPGDIDVEALKQNLLALDAVADTHHLHLWSLDGQEHVLTVHLVLRDINGLSELIEAKKEVKKLLRSYHFSHSTIEMELDEQTCSLTYRGPASS